MTEHPTFELLCDLHDDALHADAAAVAREHVSTCASCTARVAELASLADAAAGLPRSIEPPADLWTSIRAEVTSTPARSTRRMPQWSIRQLAAAAAIVAVSSSAITALVLRGRGPGHGDAVASSHPRNEPLAAQARALPASLASRESGFTRSVDVLQRTLDERRDSLAPSTVATVERSLRIADSAIAEARDALARDPGNGALVRLFASNYERKIDLLRRATELAPRT